MTPRTRDLAEGQPPDERQLVERCTAESHAALKADEARFYAGTRGGYLWAGQRFRNCILCGSTLTRDPEPTEEQTP